MPEPAWRMPLPCGAEADRLHGIEDSRIVCHVALALQLSKSRDNFNSSCLIHQTLMCGQMPPLRYCPRLQFQQSTRKPEGKPWRSQPCVELAKARSDFAAADGIDDAIPHCRRMVDGQK